ncbi:DUF6146 family protein [Flavobacterium buctense]|uniref:DUF6146 family protein n=1 Tax=Flavobacterium buctense TaxID=1648146 RepID=A0ABU9DZM9_9FLAO|nr:DUF6146 family protein [Flavobacterium buctense]
MKTVISLLFIFMVIVGCNSTKNVVTTDTVSKISDTVKIANEELEYEVIIIDPGFSSWIAGRALPRGYYSEAYLENKNQFYVAEWNNRVAQPMQYDSNLYLFRIDYDLTIRYGYEVNYLIYNYFIYFQNRYNQRLGGFVPKQ